ISKPLLIEPALPSFANITDKLIARAVVLNQTTNSGEAIVSLELDDKARATDGPGGDSLSPLIVRNRRISIPAKGSAIVEFPVEFTDTGEAKWVWRGQFTNSAAADFTDAVQSTIS